MEKTDKGPFKDFKKMDDMSPEEVAELERAAKLSSDNFGAPTDLWHPDYGWIMQDGEVTDEGKDFARELRKRGVI